MKTLKFKIGVIVISISLLGGQFVFAQESPVGSVAISEFSQGEPAILPSNPFYFFKGWGWSVKRLFTGTKIKKALVNADMLDQRATEIKKLVDIAGDNPEVIIRALTLYRTDLEAFTEQMSAVPAGIADEHVVFSTLAGRLFLHVRFTDDLVSMRHTTTEQHLLARTQLSAINTFISALSRAGTGDISAFLLGPAGVESDTYRDLRASETADSILAVVETMKGFDAMTDRLNVLIDGLLTKVAGSLTGEEAFNTVNGLATVAGNPAHRILTLTELAERTGDSDIRSALNVVRGKQIDLLRETGGIPSDLALSMIARGRLFVDAVKEIPSSKNGFALPLVRQLAERAEFNLTQSQSLYDQGNYAGAYGQAAVVIAASRSGIVLFLGVNSYEDVITQLRKEYDDLNARFKLAQISESENRNLDGAEQKLSEIESKIVLVSQRAQAKQDSSILELNIKNIKTELARVAQLLSR